MALAPTVDCSAPSAGWPVSVTNGPSVGELSSPVSNSPGSTDTPARSPSRGEVSEATGVPKTGVPPVTAAGWAAGVAACAVAAGRNKANTLTATNTHVRLDGPRGSCDIGILFHRKEWLRRAL